MIDFWNLTPSISIVGPKVSQIGLMCLLLSILPVNSVQAQTGVFGSGSNISSPRIGQTSFDGTSQQAFVSGSFQPGGVLTTDGNHLYWANPFAINRTHLLTRVTETLATYEPGTFDVQAITTDGHRLYIASAGKPISEYSMDGKLIRAVGGSTSLITGLLCDGIFIYWSHEENGLYRMRLDGTEQAQIHAEGNIMGMSGTSTHLYWANDRDRLIRRCEMDGSNPGTLVDLRSVFGATLPNGDPVNYLASGLAVTVTHVYWAVRGSYPGIYRCELDGANPVRLTTTNYASDASLVSFPSQLFPEPMQPVRPTLTYDGVARSVTLNWSCVADRRYQLLKSTDLQQFQQMGDLLISDTDEKSETLLSEESAAFFMVRKLPGVSAPSAAE
jgi:hypothetical protein